MAPRVAVAVLSLAAVPADGGTARAAGASPALRLVWLDPSDIASGIELVARAEAATLLARLGATVRWRRGTPGEIRTNDGIAVILVGEGPPAPGVAILGATRKAHPVAPIVWIRVPHVRAALGVSRSGSVFALPPVERRQFGVALGRVIAHEVVHAVVPSLPHGSGLMSGRLSRRQLTSPSIPIDLEASLALQAALPDHPVVAPSGAGVRAANAQAQ